MAKFKVQSHHLPGGSEENTEVLSLYSQSPTDIRTRDLPKTNQE
jgi:hypothetical protein